jgi:hypothetical protein
MYKDNDSLLRKGGSTLEVYVFTFNDLLKNKKKKSIPRIYRVFR